MRKLATFAAAFALGIFGAQYVLPSSMQLPLSGIFAALWMLAWLIPNEKRLRLLLVCAGLALALGYHQLYTRLVQEPMAALAGSEQTVTMTLCDYPRETTWGAKATVQIEGFSRGKAVYYGDWDLLTLTPGQTVTDRVSFQNAARIRDDDITSFTSKGIFLLAYSRSEAVYGPGNDASPRWWPLRLGHAMRGVITSIFEGDAAGFLLAILTGDTTTLSEEGKIALSEAGLYHILAVSGMHCGYLLSIVTLLTGRHRRRLLAALTIVLLVFYAILTGGSPSVLRACVMLIFLLLAPLFRRDNDPPTALSAALFLILLSNPFAAASISLQLSFGAMAGILFLTPRLYGLLTAGEKQNRVLRFLKASFASTMGALVFTIPLSAWYFGTLVLISPLSNLLCLWAAGIVFFTGLLSLCAGAVFVPLGQLIGILPALLVRYILWMAKLLSHIPYHALSFANPYLKFWLIYVYILFVLAWLIGGKTRRKYAFAALLAAFSLIFTVKLGELRYDSGLDILVLDVGQGQCILLKSGEEFILVDCGSGNSWIDAGEAAAQQLRAMGCSHLDYLLLTHYDSDHVSGVTGLMARMEVQQLLLPPDQDDAGLQSVILDAAQRDTTPVEIIRGQKHITFGETTLTIFPPLGEKEDNERGLSALAMTGTEALLITGDMSQKTEALLLACYRIPFADVLIAGHHGAKNSTSDALLEALDPETVCISVGSNSYGHPAASTLQRLAERGCTVFRTDQQGTIHIPLN